ncbi:hypothetical protein ACP6PL_26485 [Dapis sp. BLCC M126]|uniref:hypothetical protein n=1 Tax=Dapis sp. BLCC M126 TaxID=3400189 RepID=UPI003CFB1860
MPTFLKLLSKVQTSEKQPLLAPVSDENNPTLKQRVIGVLKSAGTEAFKEALDNPVANVLVAAFQGWVEP